MSARATADEDSTSAVVCDDLSTTSGFLAFFDANVDDVLRYFQLRTASAHTAADLCSETFAEALASADKFDPTRGEPRAWLFGIAKNEYRQWARLAAVERRARDRLHMSVDVAHVDELDLVELRADLSRNFGKLERAVRRLSPAVRAAVLLRVAHEQSYAEVAEALGCSEAAARVRVSRGLGVLMDRVSEEDFR